MKSLCLFAAANIITASAHNLTLSEVYGEVPHVASMEPWHKRSTIRRTRSEKYFRTRDVDECDFAIEIYILQDSTASFQDNFEEMKNTQLPYLFDAMNTQHPGSTYGIMSFRDKPIWSLGEPGEDYCQRFESPLSLDRWPIIAVYDRLVSEGGGDPSENQLGALVAALQSNTPGWSNPDAVKLIVLATDAPPHFEGDGSNDYGMAPYSGSFDEPNAEAQCLDQYYPHPQQVKDALVAREAYLATIVFDGEWWSGLPSSSWAWFNSYIGQTDDFVEPLGNTATTFFDSLSRVITAIQEVECAPESTQIPASAESTTTSSTTTTQTEMPSTSTPLTTTFEQMTTTTTSTPPTTTSEQMTTSTTSTPPTTSIELTTSTTTTPNIDTEMPSPFATTTEPSSTTTTESTSTTSSTMIVTTEAETLFTSDAYTSTQPPTTTEEDTSTLPSPTTPRPTTPPPTTEENTSTLPPPTEEDTSTITTTTVARRRANEVPECHEEPCHGNQGVVININIGFGPHGFQLQNGDQGL